MNCPGVPVQTGVCFFFSLLEKQTRDHQIRAQRRMPRSRAAKVKALDQLAGSKPPTPRQWLTQPPVRPRATRHIKSGAHMM